MPWKFEGFCHQNVTAFSLRPVGPVRHTPGGSALARYRITRSVIGPLPCANVEGTDGLGSVRQFIACIIIARSVIVASEDVERAADRFSRPSRLASGVACSPLFGCCMSGSTVSFSTGL
jgi:hypothetical protein